MNSENDEDFWIHHTHDDVRKMMNGVVDDLESASFDPRPAPENLTLLAEDAAAALYALRREDSLGNVPRGFVGGSQAGWVVPLAAPKYRDTRFMLFWSGAVQTTHENFLFERTALAVQVSASHSFRVKAHLARCYVLDFDVRACINIQ